MTRRFVLVAVLAGCGTSAPSASTSLPTPGEAPPKGSAGVSRARLPAPPAGDPAAPGAAYLATLAAQLQPRWATFLEDCRLRLGAAHALNAQALMLDVELSIDAEGRVVERAPLGTSGNGDFDTAVADVLADASPLPAPPPGLRSDDELVHVRWQFARDRRQAGAATAALVHRARPLDEVIEGLLARGELVRAVGRILAEPREPASAPNAALERAAEHVMIAALREALRGPDGTARRAAVESCGRARVLALAAEVRAQLAATGDLELRRAAIVAAGALDDRAAAPVVMASLRDELLAGAPVASARIGTLIALGRGDDAAAIVRGVLEDGPRAPAITALALVPSPGLAPRLATWSTHADAAVRAAVCTALPAAAPAIADRVIARGLDDADARVRVACVGAARRSGAVRRLAKLARDRDRAVRAAVAWATSTNGASASTSSAPPSDAAADALAAQLAAIAALPDDAALAERVRAEAPELASAALIRQTALRGRRATLRPLLTQLVGAPAGSAERVRIALAWLLAR